MKLVFIAVLALFCPALPSGIAQEPAVPAPARDSSQARGMAAARARDRLQQAWAEFGERNRRGEFRPDDFARRLQPKILSREELKSLFTETAAPFEEPEVVRSEGGKLTVTLTVAKALNKIGGDPVFLRSYNGRLTGPTLRCKPGDTLLITLRNELAPEGYEPEAMNTLHAFNSTNLHTHGLQVSPAGISDNVLLMVGPRQTQRYEIAIPKGHPCGTFWYHAHLHGSTAANVGSGMSGALIVEGGMDALPELAQAKDRVLLLQQIPYVNNASKADCPEIPPGDDLSVGVVEAAYADCHFGPRTWDRLGRFTTINGVKLPLITMRPGSVERWRLIDSALREPIQPELVRHEKSSPDAPERLTLHEIAVDGLPLGRAAPRTALELWPGYRSDVLVQAPMAPGAQYVLRDTRVPARGASFPEERRYLALVQIEGEPQPMALPADAQLARFRLPSIDPAAVTGRQVAAYGIIPKPGGQGVRFTVDRTPFGNDQARILQVGEVQEWTLTSRNNVGPVSHPFHIHVNPFEVFSVLNAQGEEQLDLDPATGSALPVWRDTIILHEGWKVSARTHYADFDGVFVHHCHILDHEDQGMMELTEVVRPPVGAAAPMAAAELSRPLWPYPAPAWELPDAGGKLRRSSEFIEGATLLVFFEGFGCLRCSEQMQSLVARYAEFQNRGVRIVAISTDSMGSLGEALKETPCPFPIMADPEMQVFRAYGCYTGGPLHGVFLIDHASTVRWQVISKMPYRDLDRLLRETAPLAPASSPQAPAARR